MTLSLDTAYRSFGGEVEASSTPTICRLPDSRRHQLSAIALSGGYASLQRSAPIDCSWQPLFGRARAWTCLGQAVALAGIPRRAGAPGYRARPERRARS